MNRKILPVLPLLFMLSSCSVGLYDYDNSLCNVVIERGNGYSCSSFSKKTERGNDVTFEITLNNGTFIESVSYPYYHLEQDAEKAVLTLQNVNYSLVVSLTTTTNYITYHLDEDIVKPYTASHPRVNTLTAMDVPSKDGNTLRGWITSEGNRIGLGSRVDAEEHDLYPDYVTWSDASEFDYVIDNGTVTLTGYKGKEKTVVLPGEIEGLPVISIGDHAFENLEAETLITSTSLKNIGASAFKDASFRELVLYDGLTSVDKTCTDGCENLEKLYINASRKPAYSGTYFDTFPDKMDRLMNLRNNKKIVLFGGSATRFGYDSSMIDSSFKGYDVVNMGVYAYGNAAPELALMLPYVSGNDILIESPEFDTVKTQFCMNKDVDYTLFAMTESNYDLIAYLDYGEWNGMTEAFSDFIDRKNHLEEQSYDIVPSMFDEEHEYTGYETYNYYGDFVLNRPNGENDVMYTVSKIDYTTKTVTEETIQHLNEALAPYLEKGTAVYFEYAPRNIISLTDESTKEERAKIDALLKEKLIFPVLGDIEESLYEPKYFYKTDNHLTNEGATIRTEKFIDNLQKALKN